MRAAARKPVKHRHGFSCLPAVLLAGWTLLAAGPALAAAGKVLFASGTVTVERNGSRALAAGDALEIGDVIVTGPASRAQLLMADGAKVALRAGSRFRIDALTLPDSVTAPGQARGTATTGSSAATLLKGGFRTVTGSVGRANPAGYQVRTPVGVLGIRGTDYAAVFCRGDCTDAPGLPPGAVIRDGLYLGVFPTGPGGIVFTPDGRAPIELGPGDFAFLPLDLAAPEALPSPPPVLDGDGAGALVVVRPGTSGLPGPGSGAPDEFSNRRAPAGADERTPAEAPVAPGNPSLNQPIEGRGPNGPVDLTGGNLPALRNLAFAVSGSGSFPDPAAAGSQPGTVQTAGGNVTAFAADLVLNDFPGTGRVAIGSATTADVGATADLRWGRWTGGSALLTRADGAATLGLTASSLHWIVDAPRSIAGNLPIAGAANFQILGGTSPTDANGAVGTLGAGSLIADFTNQTVNFGLLLTLDGVTWFGTGAGALRNGGVSFAGSGGGNLGGNVPLATSFAGFFVTPTDGSAGATGAGVSYNLQELQGNRTPVAGVIAFGGVGSQPPTPPVERRDVALAGGAFGQLAQFVTVSSNLPGDYAQDANLDLTAFAAGYPDPVAPSPADYALGSSTVAEGNYDSVTLLRWGRWSDGVATATVGGQPNSLDLLGRSLHWVVSPNAAAPPVLPVTGTASYTLAGGTSPTDGTGTVGTLGSATFDADFTNSTVSSTLALAVGQRDLTATGSGVIGAQLGLPAHQFGGSYTVGGLDNASGQPITGTGFFSGFFTAPGSSSVPGVPGGAGLAYSLQDDADGATFQGTAVFRAP